jgi:hypothetical protein
MAASCIASITLVRLKDPGGPLQLESGRPVPRYPAYALDRTGKAWQIGYGGSPDAHAP